MKNSTRIALAATVVLLGYFLAYVGGFRTDLWGLIPIALVVIWLLKFILGTFVDKKNEK